MQSQPEDISQTEEEQEGPSVGEPQLLESPGRVGEPQEIDSPPGVIPLPQEGQDSPDDIVSTRQDKDSSQESSPGQVQGRPDTTSNVSIPVPF